MRIPLLCASENLRARTFPTRARNRLLRNSMLSFSIGVFQCPTAATGGGRYNG